jgi:hypothetical protein
LRLEALVVRTGVAEPAVEAALQIGMAERAALGPPELGEDLQLAAALLAADAEKAPAEKATVEEGPELALDETGNHAGLIAGKGEKALEMTLHGAVEHGGLGRAPLVLEGIG